MQMANITLLDGQSTPASVVFLPSGFDVATNQGKWSTAGANGQTIGQKRLFLGHAENAKGIHRSKFQMMLPVVQTETIDGVSNPKVVDWITIKCEMIATSKSTTAQRKDAVAFIGNLTKDAQFTDAFVGLNDVH